jgi:hypothetical protein
MSISPLLCIYSVVTSTMQNSILMSDKSTESVETPALINCRAGGQFIDQNYAQKFTIQKLDEPLMVYNVDRTKNKRGRITSFVDLSMTINRQMMDTRLLVTGLGKQKVILGSPWLAQCWNLRLCNLFFTMLLLFIFTISGSYLKPYIHSFLQTVIGYRPHANHYTNITLLSLASTRPFILPTFIRVAHSC